MHTAIVWWDLSESAKTIGSLRTYLLDESVTAFAEVRGLRLKIWIADPQTNRWGAVLVWESAEAAAQPLPSSPAASRDGDAGQAWSAASWRAISSISFSSPRSGRAITVKLTSLPSSFQRSMSTPWT